uniref:V-set pre-B cell surrogate light chain 3 n=1 Tax=Athene cunicularia TaxID=194338 RepID=A0A663MBS6_ATHCN
MVWLRLLASLTASLVCAACRAQPVLTQPSAVLVLPGQTARLSCTLSPQYNISEFGISWYQQRPGHSLTYLLYYNSERDKHKPSDIPLRFSGPRSGSTGTLSISGVQAEDKAACYCGGNNGGISYDIC